LYIGAIVLLLLVGTALFGVATLRVESASELLLALNVGRLRRSSRSQPEGTSSTRCSRCGPKTLLLLGISDRVGRPGLLRLTTGWDIRRRISPSATP
jgi:hypothetical protein